MRAAVRALNLRKTYGNLEAVRGISFEVEEGTIVGVLGPNGAGKTTTLRMIVGLSRPTSGLLEVLGMDVQREGRKIRRRLGVVPQETTVDQELAVEDVLRVHARFYDIVGERARKRCEEVLEEFELEELAHRRVFELSGGERRRVLLARAFLTNPDLLVLDEPSLGLDPSFRKKLRALLKEFSSEGRTVLFSSHDLEEVDRISDTVLLMDGGRIVAQGPPSQIVQERVGEEVVEVSLKSSDEVPSFLQKFSSFSPRAWVSGSLVLLSSSHPRRLLEAIWESGVPPPCVSIRRSTLEDAFLVETGKRWEESP